MNFKGRFKFLTAAVTGGIGSGKSTVIKIFKEFGVNVFDLDEIYDFLCKNSDRLKKKYQSVLERM